MIRNIIFDWSGTLIDDLPAVWEATNAVFRRAGVEELTLDRFRAEFRLPFADFYKRYTPHVPKEQLEAWFHSHFKQLEHTVKEIPHARDFLIACRRRKIRTFVLSTINRLHFEHQARATGFEAYLDRPYLEVMDKRTKIRELIAENQLAPEETLFIGDMEHDIETARHGGILSCAVLTGFSIADRLRAAGPDLLVEHLGELQRTLDINDWNLPKSESGPVRISHEFPVTTVGALVYNSKGDVLMVRTHKWSNLWGIPGGKIRTGETAEAALRREIREETGLEIERIEFVMVQDCISSKEFYRDAHFVLLNYTCRCSGPEDVRLNEEAQEFCWVPPSEALRLQLNRPTRILLEAVIESGAESAGTKDTIEIRDLEVFYRVGVPAEERRNPQRLLLSVELTGSFAKAAAADNLAETIDYFQIAQRLARFGEDRSWKLIETVAVDIAQMILAEFEPEAVAVEVKKFIIPETRYVAVRVARHS